MGETLTDGASVILGGWIRIYTDRILVGLGKFYREGGGIQKNDWLRLSKRDNSGKWKTDK